MWSVSLKVKHRLQGSNQLPSLPQRKPSVELSLFTALLQSPSNMHQTLFGCTRWCTSRTSFPPKSKVPTFLYEAYHLQNFIALLHHRPAIQPLLSNRQRYSWSQLESNFLLQSHSGRLSQPYSQHLTRTLPSQKELDPNSGIFLWDPILLHIIL